MVKLQLENYIVTVNDDNITINNTAATWKLEISILNPRYQLLSYMVNEPTMHPILSAYAYINYLSADNIFIDEQYMQEFTKSYNECAKRYNAKMKENTKVAKVKTPKTNPS